MKRYNPLKKAPVAETARVENTQVGHCPVCMQQNFAESKMKQTIANGVKCYVCYTHRVCLPCED